MDLNKYLELIINIVNTILDILQHINVIIMSPFVHLPDIVKTIILYTLFILLLVVLAIIYYNRKKIHTIYV